jgi:hypothetical protein
VTFVIKLFRMFVIVVKYSGRAFVPALAIIYVYQLPTPGYGQEKLKLALLNAW